MNIDKYIYIAIGALLLFLGGVVCYAFRIGWPAPCPEIVTVPLVHPVVSVPLDSGNVHITPAVKTKLKPKDTGIKKDSQKVVYDFTLDSSKIKNDSGICINFGQKFPSGDSVAAMLCSKKIPLTLPDINGYLMLYPSPDTQKKVIMPPVRVNKRFGVGPYTGFGWGNKGGWQMNAGIGVSFHAIEF